MWQQASKRRERLRAATPLSADHSRAIHQILNVTFHPTIHPTSPSIQQASSRGVEVPSQRCVCVYACLRVYAVTLLLSAHSRCWLAG